ncbi:hypothetical protein [Gynurincola endophyticus]|uniref:hypothetical protein n=1 Tax=Gynurincola endophyticus TaxID=2479004 RepID=UPI000F8DF1CA|nr:hypothetical protein [Gynurincola endophyticus]
MSAVLQRYYLQSLQEEVLCRFDSRKATLSTGLSYDELSEDILKATKIKISAQHLKRFFGSVKYDDFPPQHQLDVLANYINADCWNSFQSKLQQTISFQERQVPFLHTIEPLPALPFSFNQRQELLYILLFLMILAIGLILLNI